MMVRPASSQPSSPMMAPTPAPMPNRPSGPFRSQQPRVDLREGVASGKEQDFCGEAVILPGLLMPSEFFMIRSLIGLTDMSGTCVPLSLLSEASGGRESPGGDIAEPGD